VEEKADLPRDHGQDDEGVDALVEQVAEARQGLLQIAGREGLREVEDRVVARASDHLLHVRLPDLGPVPRIGDQQVERLGGIPQPKPRLSPQDDPRLGAERLAVPREFFPQALHHETAPPCFAARLQEREHGAPVGHHLEELLSPVHRVGRHDQDMPFRQARRQEILEGLRAARPRAISEAVRDAVLQHPGEPFLPLRSPFLPRELPPLFVWDPPPALVAEMLEAPARQVEQGHKVPGRRWEVRFDGVGDLPDQLRDGGLRVEEAGLPKDHGLRARDEGGGQEGLAYGMHPARFVIHHEQAQVPVLLRDQGVDDLPQGLFHEKVLVPVQEVAGRALPLRDVPQDTLETLFRNRLSLAHDSISPKRSSASRESLRRGTDIHHMREKRERIMPA